MKQLFLFLLVTAYGISSCVPTFKVRRMKYDENAGFYVYKNQGKNVALRLESGELVFRDSLKSFLADVANNDFHYNIDNKSENTLLFLPEEKTMLELYNAVMSSVSEKDPFRGLTLANEFNSLYPNAYKYTDIDFLKGQLWEQLGSKDSAMASYNRFYFFAEKKYSGFFRGYENDEMARDCFLKERKYASAYLNNTVIEKPENSCYPQLSRKYYYQSFSQGFVLNREDFGPLKKTSFGIGLEYDKQNKLSAGISNTWLVNEKYIYQAGFNYSKNKAEFLIAGSFQLYKTNNNAFGLKLNPSLSFIQFAGNDSLSQKNSLINPGLGISAGYRFNQRWYFGASYQAFLYNQYTYKKLKKNYYTDNSYDISLYYQLIRGISFKLGIDSGYAVFGFGLTNSTLGYFFKNRSFGVRMNDF